MRNPPSLWRAGSYFAACALAACSAALWSRAAAAHVEAIALRAQAEKPKDQEPQDQKPTPQPKDLVQASLGPSLVRITGGEAVVVSVRVAPHWHIYWSNPGDSGAAPKVTLALPEGWTAGEVVFPRPQVLGDESERTFGYEGVVHLLVPVRRPDGAQGTVDVRGEMSWLACRTSCVSGRSSLSGQVSVSVGDAPSGRAWPSAMPASAHATLEGSGDARTLRIEIPANAAPRGDLGAGGSSIGQVTFIPDDCAGVRWQDGTGPFALARGPGGAWTLQAGCAIAQSDAPKAGIRLRGLLLWGPDATDPAFQVDLPVPGAPTLPVP